MTGMNCAAATTPSQIGSWVSSRTSQACATCCIQVPTSEIAWPREEQPVVAVAEGAHPVGSREPARLSESRPITTGPAGATRALADALRVRRRAAVELGQVGVEVSRAGACLLDHRGEAGGLGLEDLDLVLDPRAGFEDERAPLVGVAGLAEALAVALARRLVLEQLADLGEREPGVVAEARG